MKKLLCLNVKIKRTSSNQTLRHTCVIPPSYARSSSAIAKLCETFPLKIRFLSFLERASGAPAHLRINVAYIAAQTGGSTPISLNLKGQ
jgi:hypothetical protein